MNEIPVIVGPGDQKSPVTSGNTVYYVDSYAHSNKWLMKKDLFGGTPEDVVGPGLSTGPDADAGTVAWHRESKFCRRLPGGVPDQCMSTTTSLHDVAYSGNYGISEGGTSMIRVYDFEGGSSRIADQATMSGMRYDPDIDGNQAVWVKMRGYAGRYYEPLIVLYDVDKEIATYMTEPGGGTVASGASKYDRREPAISGTTIAYQERYNEPMRTWDIKLASMGTQGITLAEEPGDQVNPAIDGNIVVYQDNRTGHWNEAGQWVGEWNIYMKDIVTGVEQPVCTARGDQVNPRIKDGVIVWEDNRDGNWDIYGAVLSPAADDAQLLESYAPRLVLHPDEDFRPMEVSGMVAGPGTTLVDGGQEKLRAPESLTLDALGGFDSDSFIDLPGACLICGPHPVDAVFDRYTYTQYVKPYEALAASGVKDGIYGRVVHRGATTVIQYWLSYYFNNHPLISHEGDWELIEVELGSDGQPSRMSLSQHDYGKKRYWRDVELAGGHPVVYVARGSHANYFEPGDHLVKLKGILSPVTDETSEKQDGVLLEPQVTQLPGSAFDLSVNKWMNFSGHWGEMNGNPDGDSPVGPAWSGERWTNPFAWSGLEWDRYGGVKGALIGLGLQVARAVNVDLFDLAGDGAGALAGTTVAAQTIDGARSIDLPDLGARDLFVPFDTGASYRLLLTSTESVSTPVSLTVADRAGGTVTELSFGEISLAPGEAAILDIPGGFDPAGLRLGLDPNGDGAPEEWKLAGQTQQTSVDIAAPAAVDDLSVVKTARNSARLAWTAPGDDADVGTAVAYAVRYYDEPVTEENWASAEPAEVDAAPAAAGSAETLDVAGLPEEKVYFGIRSYDESGNESGLSEPAVYSAEPPALTLYLQTATWSSYSDYLSRELTVRYLIENRGLGTAGDVLIRQVATMPVDVALKGPVPETVEWLDPGESFTFGIRFEVPDGNVNFVTSLSASCTDLEGREIWYGPPAG